MGNLAFGTAGSSYYDWARKGNVFCAYALVTAPVIYSTAAGTGGPLLWNNSAAGSQAVNAALLGISMGTTVASAAGSVMGITGNNKQPAAPTSTTAIDAVANLFVGGPAPQCNTYRVGTVANAGSFFMPTHMLSTTALTALTDAPGWVDLGGLIVVPPGSWASAAAAVTATTAQIKVGLVWAEIPL